MVSDLVLEVQGADRVRVGWLGEPVAASMTPRHNQRPTGNVTLALDDPKCAYLQRPGARVRSVYRGEHLLGGPVRSWRTDVQDDARVRVFEVVDDWWLLGRILAWPVPGAALSAQTSEYRTITGPAETVVKTLVAENAARLGAPVTVASDMGRGATITVQARMASPEDVLFPLVDQAGIGVTVTGGPAGFVVDCYVPSNWPIHLSEAGGTLAGVSWSQKAPTVTRAVVGADGDGAARVFRQYVNTALETALGYQVETFVDARDIKHTDADFEVQAAARGAAAIAAGALTSGIELDLAETSVFRYGGAGVHCGDRLTIDLDETTSVVDVLRSATVSLSSKGLQVTPVVGGFTDDPSLMLAASVAQARTDIRRLARS